MSDKIENPVLLWGDLGPDVYRLSQIYDPRNDRYVVTQDTKALKDKTYYQRLELILTNDEHVVIDPTTKVPRDYYERITTDEVVTYRKVDLSKYPADVNPKSQKWFQSTGGKIYVFVQLDLAEGTPIPSGEDLVYEVNPDPKDLSGKFVPAVDSPVVVDDVDCDYKRDNGYKTRQLLFVKSVDRALNVTFAPLAFGQDTEETPRAVDYGNEKFMLYFDRRVDRDKNIILTPDRKLLQYGLNTYGYWLKRKGEVISSNLPTIQVENEAFIPYTRAVAKRVTLTEENYEFCKGSYLDFVLENGMQRMLLLSEDDVAFLPTLDQHFRSGVLYYKEDGSLLSGGVDYRVNENIHYWEKNHETHVVQQQKTIVIGKTAFAHKNPADTVSNVYVPNRCYLRRGLSISDGEPITMEVFEFNFEEYSVNQIMSVELIAREASALDVSDVSTRQIVSFDVDLNGRSTSSDIWYLQQGADLNDLQIIPTIRFDDGSNLVVPVDGQSCFRYGFENIKTNIPGREFPVLFKFFPHKSIKVDWQRFGYVPTNDFLVCRKIVKIINGLENQIRKISLIPSWNPVERDIDGRHMKIGYDFNFLVYKYDYLPPRMVRSCDWRVGGHGEALYSQPMFNRTRDTYVENKQYYMRENSGNFLPIDTTSYYSARMKVVDAEARETEAAGRPIVFFERESVPVINLRNIRYLDDTGTEKDIGWEEAGTKNYGKVHHAHLAVNVVSGDQSASSVYTQRVAFRLQDMRVAVLRDKWRIGDDCSGYDKEQLPYGNPTNRPYMLYSSNEVDVPTEDGSTEKKVTHTFQLDPDSGFKTVNDFLEAFYYNAILGADMTIDHTKWMRPTHFYLRSIAHPESVSKFVPIHDTDGIYNAIVLDDPGEAIRDIAGGIPDMLIDEHTGDGVAIYGTIVVEFVHYDEASNTYKSLYGVPVETKLYDWVHGAS